MYLELQTEGYLVDYERVPITDEKSPKETDFDILVSFYILNVSLHKDLSMSYVCKATMFDSTFTSFKIRI